MATQRNTHGPADASFIHSLAPIWRDLSRSKPRSKSQSRRSSTNDSDEIEGRRSRGDQRNSGGRTYSKSITPKSGVLNMHEHNTTRSRSGGAANNYTSTPNSPSSPKRSPRRSLRNTPKWPPPPPPPRNCSINSNSVPSAMIRQGNTDLSKVLQPNQVAKLPFCAESDGRRRHSMLELEEIGDTDVQHTARCPPPPLFDRRRSDGDGRIFVSAHQEFKERSHIGNLLGYVLGDSPRCHSHMIVETCPKSAIERVSRLNRHDFAFVKRSNGSWSYAILADRHVAINNEEHMMFVLNGMGYTKIVERSQWGKCVSCVAIDIKDHVPKTISINKDDCSLISSI